MFDFIFNLNYWVFLGLFGQFLFFTRFVVQWIHSEKRGESVIPVAFWYLSIAGALVLLVYSFYIQDIVFILGFTLTILIYARNLYLIKKQAHKKVGTPLKEDATSS